MGFTDMHELDASSLGEIMRQLGQLDLDPSKCISQCYGGASVMSGHLSGVQAIVQHILGHSCLICSLLCSPAQSSIGGHCSRQ